MGLILGGWRKRADADRESVLQWADQTLDQLERCSRSGAMRQPFHHAGGRYFPHCGRYLPMGGAARIDLNGAGCRRFDARDVALSQGCLSS